MKRVLLILALICTTYQGAAQAGIYLPTTIKTPNGSVVPDTFIHQGADMSLTGAEISAIKEELRELYNSAATMVSPPSYKYNCHAYAWHITEGGSNVWLGYNTTTAHFIYWADKSYIEVNESAARKVVYTGNHSAIRFDSDRYQSKWGQYALVSHHPNAVPVDYEPSSPRHYYVRNNLQVSGPTNPTAGTNVTFSVPSVPSGVTFDNWTVSKNSYTTIGGVGYRELKITFTAAGTYTLTANYTLMGGEAYTASTTINVNAPPPLPPAGPSLSSDLDTVNDPEHYGEAVYWQPSSQSGYFYVT
ncbi:MAG: Ig-like domain-containing protein, partial [Alistipes sp.]|nr:Ig-like domain-containing protein [Alistipes sp.]